MARPLNARVLRRARIFLLPVLAALGIALAQPGRAAEAIDERAPLLYENHCVACHDSQAHVRANRKARSLADVRAWVSRWAAHLGLGWSAETRDGVARYVYRTWYAAGS